MPPVPQPDTIIVPENRSGDYYTLVRHMHKGRMSNAYEAVSSGGTKVFLKSYSTPAPETRWYKSYITYTAEVNQKILNSDAAENCLKKIAAFEAKIGNCPWATFFQVYEFIEGGYDLETLLGAAVANPAALPWARRVAMAKVFLAGLKKLHAAGIVHCDLKPANLQMPPVPAGIGFRPLIVDTDFSILAGKRAPWHGEQGYIGTPDYYSPEHLLGGDVAPTAASDVFTAALILYQLLGQGNPYKGNSPEEYREKVFSGAPPKIIFQGEFRNPQSNEELSATLQRALAPNPAVRPTSEELHKLFIATGDTIGTLPPAVAETVRQHVANEIISLQLGTGDNANPTGRDAAKITFSQSTKVGKKILEQLSPEGKFASEPQFELIRAGSSSANDFAWLLAPVATAQNLTLLNGKVLENRTQINTGDILSLCGRTSGRQALRMCVRLE